MTFSLEFLELQRNFLMATSGNETGIRLYVDAFSLDEFLFQCSGGVAYQFSQFGVVTT
jgi:hypothetical protein